MSDGLRRGDYSRDPVEILMEREASTCKGCTHARRIQVFRTSAIECRTTERVMAAPGRRCVKYDEGEK